MVKSGVISREKGELDIKMEIGVMTGGKRISQFSKISSCYISNTDRISQRIGSFLKKALLRPTWYNIIYLLGIVKDRFIPSKEGHGVFDG